MHHFIYSTKDAWISSGSNTATTGISEKDQNYGKDQILEIKKNFYNDSFDYPTRALIDFSGTQFTEMSKSIIDGTITNPSFYLRLYEAEGTTELSENYTLDFKPISQSWTEGTGKFGDNPKVTNGVSWENVSNNPGASAITWSNGDGTPSHGCSVFDVSSSTQTFSNQSPDVQVNITDMTKGWLSGSGQDGGFGNYGLLVRFSGSQETDTSTFGQLKFFSTETHTIYAPRLEVKWDDVNQCTGDNTGSMYQITSSGLVDNYVYPIGLKESYHKDEKGKFRFGLRKRYIQKTFSESVQTITGSYIPAGSGSYSIVDLSTGETVVPFKDIDGNSYTSLGCDGQYNYFNQWLSGFEPNRYYKILIKVKYDDKQEIIYDDNFEFKIVNQ
jgi:hypothetical protein